VLDVEGDAKDASDLEDIAAVPSVSGASKGNPSYLALSSKGILFEVQAVKGRDGKTVIQTLGSIKIPGGAKADPDGEFQNYEGLDVESWDAEAGTGTVVMTFRGGVTKRGPTSADTIRIPMVVKPNGRVSLDTENMVRDKAAQFDGAMSGIRPAAGVRTSEDRSGHAVLYGVGAQDSEDLDELKDGHPAKKGFKEGRHASILYKQAPGDATAVVETIVDGHKFEGIDVHDGLVYVVSDDENQGSTLFKFKSDGTLLDQHKITRGTEDQQKKTGISGLAYLPKAAMQKHGGGVRGGRWVPMMSL